MTSLKCDFEIYIARIDFNNSRNVLKNWTLLFIFVFPESESVRTFCVYELTCNICYKFTSVCFCQVTGKRKPPNKRMNCENSIGNCCILCCVLPSH